MRTLSLALLALFALTGCPKKKDAVPDAAPSAAASDTAAPSASAEEDAAPPPTAAVDPDWVPTHTADDTKAKKDIGKANYKQELDSLDKEISAEK